MGDTFDDFDLEAASRTADALAATLPDPEQQARIYDAISYRVALAIISGEHQFKSIREALEAAKIFQKIASDLRSSTAKQLAAQAAEDTAESLKNLTAPQRQQLLKELTAKAQDAARGHTDT